MRGIHHRDPGPVGVALNRQNINCGLIADGRHVHPMIVSLIKNNVPGRIFLVSDCLWGYGLNVNNFDFCGRRVEIHGETCKLMDGTFAGVVSPLLEGTKNLARWTKDPSHAIWASTIAPRQIINKKKFSVDYFVGKNLTNLLRWRYDKDHFFLDWSFAK